MSKIMLELVSLVLERVSELVLLASLQSASETTVNFRRGATSSDQVESAKMRFLHNHSWLPHPI